jgi:hypothetical protein
MIEATHEITACYFPGTGEVELTWRDLQTGETAGMTAKVSKKIGEKIASVVYPCVNNPVIIKSPPR